MIDWSGCPQVISRPGFLSGAPALRGDPRVPASTIIENIDSSEVTRLEDAAREVIENFDLRTSLDDVLAIYNYAKSHEVQHVA